MSPDKLLLLAAPVNLTSLAKQTVTVHQYLDGSVSIRFGPNLADSTTPQGNR